MEPAPQFPRAFLRWRLECLEKEIKYFEVAEAAVNEAGKQAEFLDRVQKELSTLEAEKLILLEQNRSITEGLEDTSRVASDAYIGELEYAFANTSGYGAQKWEQPKLDRQTFKKKVAGYLNSLIPNSMHGLLYCNVLGEYIWTGPTPGIKCAQIVPFSFDTKQLPYMFGSEEAALRSPRNGLMLYSPIEEALDNGEIAIVPHGSIDSNPTEWKIIVLHTDLFNKFLWESPFTGATTTWNEIHNRPLVWKNDNRPARRYLYLRYVLTWLAARRKGYPDWQEKLPSGTMWATPDKPGGYLRSSILRVLASKVGDKTPLPEDMMIAGSFDDPDSASKVKDQAAAIALPLLVRDHLEGRKAKAAAAEDDEEDDEEEEDDDEEDDEEEEDADDDEEG
ncbi:MAG: hypothetical protein L6R42_010134 [Xanthoria sp. 1 TBL-2021]|nr:MAG: hypothetical protein L6R42_010134 [Xanthoria sp. 1 TBL-2021]